MEQSSWSFIRECEMYKMHVLRANRDNNLDNGDHEFNMENWDFNSKGHFIGLKNIFKCLMKQIGLFEIRIFHLHDASLSVYTILKV